MNPKIALKVGPKPSPDYIICSRVKNIRVFNISIWGRLQVINSLRGTKVFTVHLCFYKTQD